MIQPVDMGYLSRRCCIRKENIFDAILYTRYNTIRHCILGGEIDGKICKKKKPYTIAVSNGK